MSWATRFPFSEVSCLLREFCGEYLLSEDTIWRWVQAQARCLDAQQQQIIQEVADQSMTDLPEPEYIAPIDSDLYDSASEEFITLTDAIGVASQKPTRQKADEEKCKKAEKRHDTDVMILPTPDGNEWFFSEGMSESWSLVESARAFLRKKWSGKTLKVVAITDGAKTIRADLSHLFGPIGQGVRIVLDWYHLAKRVYQNLSMVAHSMKEREAWEREMLGLLWHGRVSEAIDYLSLLPARNAKAKNDLMGYLQKHFEEIIDYGRRQQVGKPIGSGRMEKGVDQVIGIRQKNRGMSWTKAGSRALALLKVAELNARYAG